MGKKKFVWWKHGTIYHIYVRSFFDSNNDGVGDIGGILQKLDYLKTLGVDALWLSPMYASPHIDFGYDVADYKSIDPVYGTIDDFKHLLNEAHKRDIKIIIDMILNHTSDQHPWFLESRSSVDNCKRDWYIWKKGSKFKAPNNWRTSFGRKAWQYDSTTQEYYYHSFFREQPDLNWRNKDMQKAMFAEIRFWLDMGVDGLRLDVINYIVKDKEFRNNPSFLHQLLFSKKVYTRNRFKSIKILRALRSLLDEYPQTTSVGEIFTLPPGDSKLVAQYIDKGKNALHLAFDFTLIFTRWNAQKVGQAIQASYKHLPPKGWPSIVLSNHDLNRSYSRPFFKKTRLAKAKLKALLMFTLHGTPFIYYGEEIGMENYAIARHKLRDPLGKMYWPLYSGRDKCRTPMQWNDSPFAGFSKSKPWLPIHSNFKTKNVEKQTYDKNSLLNLFQQLIAFRKSSKILHKGKWELLDVQNKYILAYKRMYKESTIVMLLNFSCRTQNVHFTPAFSVLFQIDTTYSLQPDALSLKGFDGVILKLENERL